MGLRLTNFRRTGQPGLRTRYEGLYISTQIRHPCSLGMMGNRKNSSFVVELVV